MKVKVKYDDQFQDNEIELTISPKNNNVNSYVKFLNGEDVRLVTGKRDNKLFLIDLINIESFYTQAGKVLFYSNGEEYEVSEKLYELDAKYRSKCFMRISKAVIVNLNKIEYLEPAFNRQLMLKLESGREEYSSRFFYKSIKERLGV